MSTAAVVNNDAIGSVIGSFLDKSGVYVSPDATKNQRLTALANRVMENIWPWYQIELLRSFYYRKVVQPVDHIPLEHGLPWTYDTTNCWRCGKTIIAAVLRTTYKWEAENFCPECRPEAKALLDQLLRKKAEKCSN